MSDQGRFLREVWRHYGDTATPPHNIQDLDAWRQRVAHNAMREHTERARALIVFVPDATPAEIVHAIRNRLTPEALTRQRHLAATVRAQAANLQRSNEHRATHNAPPDWELGKQYIAQARRYLEDR